MQHRTVAKTLLTGRRSKSLGVPFIYRRCMWYNCCRFGVYGFFFFFSSLLLNFHPGLQKNQISPGVYCPYIRFHSYSLHYNFLFRIIYESKFFFSISSPINFFHLSDLILILFIAIYFILDGF